MRKRGFVILLLTLIGVGICLQSQAKTNLEAEVSAVLSKQAEAWNRGDLDGFMTSYLQSPDISYVAADGEIWGYDALRKRYETKYGASRDTMGKLTFSDLKISELAKDRALCVGHWYLKKRDGKPDVSGIFSLIFVNAKDGWKILHDHTSVDAQH